MRIIRAFFLAISLIGILLSCNPEAPEEHQVFCTSGEAVEIDYFSARINGSATIYYAKEEKANAFFYFSPSAKDIASLKSTERIAAGEISANGGSFDMVLNDLDPATKYYYLASVVIDGDEFVGQVKSFSTRDLPSESVTTCEFSNLTECSVSLSASFHPQYDNQDVAKGFLYSVNSSLDPSDCERIETVKVSDYSYSADIDGLFSSTKYYYKAYIEVEPLQYKYGEIKSFTTETVKASVVTLEASEVNRHECVLQGKLEVNSKAPLSKTVNFYYSKTATTVEALIANGTRKTSSLSNEGTFTVNLTGLDDDETYYFLATAHVHDKDFYGDVASFKTLAYPYKVSTLGAEVQGVSVCTINGTAICNIEGAQFSTFFYVSNIDNTIEGLVSNGRRIEVDRNDDNSFSFQLTNLNPQSKYYFVAGCVVDGVDHFASISSFNTGKLVLEPVDLGLSVKWSSCNIGASKPEEYGCYYAWGELLTKEVYNKLTYKWFTPDGTKITKYNGILWSEYRDDKFELDPEDDVAQVLTDGKWRMPSTQDIRELFEKCTWEYTTREGVTGCLVTSKINNNSIFIPASGVYNGTNLYTGKLGNVFSTFTMGDDSARSIYFYESERLELGYSYRYLGHPVRPVCN